MYRIVLIKQAVKDAKVIEQAGLKLNVAMLLRIICENPYQNPPKYEKLKGDLYGSYSRRINKKHRLVYDILPNDGSLADDNGEIYKGIVKVLRMWTHYE